MFWFYNESTFEENNSLTVVVDFSGHFHNHFFAEHTKKNLSVGEFSWRVKVREVCKVKNRGILCQTNLTFLLVPNCSFVLSATVKGWFMMSRLCRCTKGEDHLLPLGLKGNGKDLIRSNWAFSFYINFIRTFLLWYINIFWLLEESYERFLCTAGSPNILHTKVVWKRVYPRSWCFCWLLEMNWFPPTQKVHLVCVVFEIYNVARIDTYRPIKWCRAVQQSEYFQEYKKMKSSSCICIFK